MSFEFNIDTDEVREIVSKSPGATGLSDENWKKLRHFFNDSFREWDGQVVYARNVKTNTRILGVVNCDTGELELGWRHSDGTRINAMALYHIEVLVPVVTKEEDKPAYEFPPIDKLGPDHHIQPYRLMGAALEAMEGASAEEQHDVLAFLGILSAIPAPITPEIMTDEMVDDLSMHLQAEIYANCLWNWSTQHHYRSAVTKLEGAKSLIHDLVDSLFPKEN